MFNFQAYKLVLDFIEIINITEQNMVVNESL